MCGIAGVYLGCQTDRAVCPLLEAAIYLQHRGQDACGIVTATHGGESYCHRNSGLATEVFRGPHDTDRLVGHMGLLQLRYPTAGVKTGSQLQPFYCEATRTYLTHNGNLTNAPEVREHLSTLGVSSPEHGIDTQVLLDVFSLELQQMFYRNPTGTPIAIIASALKGVYARCKGSFSCIALVKESVVVGFRDSNGIKPLCYGRKFHFDGTVDYMLSSESVALEALGFGDIIDVKAGEAVFITKDPATRNPQVFCQQIVSAASPRPDIFEYLYLSRPESVIDGIGVYRSRSNAGVALAETIREQLGPEELDEIDVVIPIPETSYTAASALAATLRKPYMHGFVKNVYSKRTFIIAGQNSREKAVRHKLNAVTEVFQGKTVLLVDDSIVRGTTSREIIKMARAAGAKKIIFGSCSPPIRFNHVHGIDLANGRELIAFGRTIPQIRDLLGCDGLIYLPIHKLVAACLMASKASPVKAFEVGVFTGNYVTDGPEGYPQCVEEPLKKRWHQEHLEKISSYNVVEVILNEGN